LIKTGAAVVAALLIVGCSPSGAITPSSPTARPSVAIAGGTPACLSSMLVFLTLADQPSYSRGANVVITEAVRNGSSQPCAFPPRDASTDPGIVITDAAGQIVWDTLHYAPPGPLRPPGPLGPLRPLLPGESISRAWTWNQVAGEYDGTPLAGPLVPLGKYLARANWYSYPVGALAIARFSIEPA
jgi:hypothetical protein